MKKTTPWFVRWLPKLMYVTAAVGALDTLFSDQPVLDFITTWLVPVPLFDFVTVVLAVILAAALDRQKRAAWRLMFLIIVPLLILMIFITVIAIGSWSRFPEVGETLAIVGANAAQLILVGIGLWYYRDWYKARTQPGNLSKALLVLAVGLTGTTVIAIIIQSFTRGFGFRPVVRMIGEALGITPAGSAPNWLMTGLLFCYTLVFIAAFWTLLRSQRNAAHLTIDDEVRVRELLAATTADSLGYFSTRRDKSAVLTEHGAVTYRVVMGVCLVGGDPLGEKKYWDTTARAFVQHATEYGWLPAVMAASREGAKAYQAAGLRALHIGDEAVLHSATFSLHDLPDVRRAVERLRDLGYTLRIRRHGSIPPEELRHLAALADSWRQGDDERGFSMALGRLGEPADRDCVMVEALFPPQHSESGTAGLLSFVPWGADGASLDVMRRHPRADHGVTELMVAGLMTEGGDLGVRRVSLNFAVFRSAFEAGEQIGAGPVSRLWRRLLVIASRWWQLESLYRSNDKYHPDWVPRMLCYPDGNDLGRVGIASGIAEGFVRLPRILGGGDTEQPILTGEAAAPLLAVTRPVVSVPVRRVSEQVRRRFGTRETMLDEGLEPYAVSYPVTASCACAEGEAGIAGRVVAVRDHGGVIFCVLRDFTGDLQVVIERDAVGEDSLALFRRIVRLGDQIGVHGRVGASRTGTRSLLASSWTMTSKALRPLPDMHSGFTDPEARVRQRYLDLVMNRGQRDLLRARSDAFRAVRETLQSRGYLEVETPILQSVHGGANARPFRTHINAYDIDLYLRIAPELYLKRLLVGGVDRVFEMGRNFRNEGADATHNPEFTMLEAYQSYADYAVMRDVIRDLVLSAARAATGGTVVRGKVNGVEHEIDLTEPWAVVSITDAVSSGVGEHVTADTPLPALQGYADRLGINYDPRWGWGAMLQELYEHLAESSTVTPTFFSDFPAETSPLTRPHRVDPRLAERWDLIIFGSELGTAYSELIDPVIQRQRLTAQSLAAAGGDPEAMQLDEAFLRALEHGMPPAGGLGMGLDRLVMMLTGTSIRQTIAFPLVKPR